MKAKTLDKSFEIGYTGIIETGGREMGKWTTQYTELPETMTFDELVAHPLYSKYVDNGFAWQILLKNGTWYGMTLEDHEIGRKCPPDACVDRVMI